MQNSNKKKLYVPTRVEFLSLEDADVLTSSNEWDFVPASKSSKIRNTVYKDSYEI